VLRSFFPQKPELKSQRELGLMREAGKLVAEALREVGYDVLVASPTGQSGEVPLTALVAALGMLSVALVGCQTAVTPRSCR